MTDMTMPVPAPVESMPAVSAAPAPPQPAGFRVPLRWLPADNMPYGGGDGDEPFYPYEGQGIWVLPAIPADLKMVGAEMMAVQRKLTKASESAQAAEANGDEPAAKAAEAQAAKCIEALADLMRRVRAGLSNVVAGWTLTDMVGDPLPSPWRNTDAWGHIDENGLAWVLGSIQSGEPLQRPVQGDESGN